MLWQKRGQRQDAVRKVVGIRRGMISDNMRVSFQAARSMAAGCAESGFVVVASHGAVRKVVGIRRGVISDNMRVSFQAARSMAAGCANQASW